MRVIKFVRKGYNVQAPTLAGVITRIALEVDMEAVSRRRHRGGEHNVDDEKWVTRIVTGLLREVDPLQLVDGVEMIDEHELLDGSEETAK